MGRDASRQDEGQDQETTIHGTAVALDGGACLLLGPSGSGKSALALSLMAMGAELISDDRVTLRRAGQAVIVAAPEAIRGMIEARGVGLLNAPAHAPVPLRLAVDLGQTETERLPPPRETAFLGVAVPLLHKAEHAAFSAAIRLYLLYGRRA